MSVRAPLKPSPFETADTFELGRFKRARRAYGFDEVALVPGRVTINPEEVDSSFQLGALHLDVPILAAAMDRDRLDAIIAEDPFSRNAFMQPSVLLAMW